MMYSATKDENRICGYSDNSLGRFLLREKLIDHLREEGDLSDDELAIAAKYYPELLVYNMNPDSRVVLAYVKEGNPLSRDTFPERVWEDREVLYQAFCNKRHLPSAANKRVDELLIKRFLEEHSDQEILSFLQERSYLKNKVKHLIKDEALLSRIDETNRKTIEYEDEPKTSLLDNMK